MVAINTVSLAEPFDARDRARRILLYIQHKWLSPASIYNFSSCASDAEESPDLNPHLRPTKPTNYT